jgi:hypothetical protein
VTELMLVDGHLSCCSLEERVSGRHLNGLGCLLYQAVFITNIPLQLSA